LSANIDDLQPHLVDLNLLLEVWMFLLHRFENLRYEEAADWGCLHIRWILRHDAQFGVVSEMIMLTLADVKPGEQSLKSRRVVLKQIE
jgi:hypothetical protein